MDYDFEIYRLSAKFIEDHPADKYPELMYKAARPYNCMLIETHDDYFICVPFRSHINHGNAYMFKNSVRSRTNNSGLDYSKIVIIKDISYLDSSGVVVDQDEYREAVQNSGRIMREALKYVQDYIDHRSGKKVHGQKAFDRLYKFSTLKYFEEIIIK